MKKRLRKKKNVPYLTLQFIAKLDLGETRDQFVDRLVATFEFCDMIGSGRVANFKEDHVTGEFVVVSAKESTVFPTESVIFLYTLKEHFEFPLGWVTIHYMNPETYKVTVKKQELRKNR